MPTRLLRLTRDKRAKRLALLALLWLPAVVVLVVVREVLLPFLLAFALAYVIAPPVRWLSAKGLPRWASVLVLYALAALVVVAAGRVFVPQLYKELTRLGGDANAAFQLLSDEEIARRADDLEGWVKRNDIPINIVTAEDADVLAPSIGPAAEPAPRGALTVDLVGAVQDLIRDAKRVAKERAIGVVGQLQTVVASTVRFVFSTFLVLMLTAFIIADLDRFASFFFTIVPIRDRDRFQELLSRIDRGLSGVVRGQLTICLINGVLTLVGLLLLKVKFAFLLATVAAVFSLIPIFGSILSTIPIVIVGMSSGPTTAVLAVLWIVGIHALEANLLNPKIMGDAAKIHPVLVVLALVTGEHFYGLAGALFAVPLMSVLVTVWKAIRSRAIRLDEELAPDDAADEVPQPGGATRHRRVRLVDGG